MKVDFERAIEEIKRRGSKRVGIQLPDGLRRRTFEIAEEIERRTDAEVIISGNTCFGACDIDLHLLHETDLLVHFAHSPIGEMNKVLFVSVTQEFEIEDLMKEALSILGKRVSVVTTAQHFGVLEKAKKMLEESGRDVIIKKPRRSPNPGHILGCDFSAVAENSDILFIGTGDFHALGISLFTEKDVVVLDPLKNEVRVVNAEKMKRKRYLIVSKCFEAKKFGIIVSSKPYQKRLSLARTLRDKAKKKGLRAEIIYLDTILYETLLNFDADAYVNTACPRFTYDDAELHPKPVITPEEFLVVLGEKKLEEVGVDQM
jgi:2-(3-amino-3-carboxypropyl)histidine synthase